MAGVEIRRRSGQYAGGGRMFGVFWGGYRDEGFWQASVAYPEIRVGKMGVPL